MNPSVIFLYLDCRFLALPLKNTNTDPLFRLLSQAISKKSKKKRSFY